MYWNQKGEAHVPTVVLKKMSGLMVSRTMRSARMMPSAFSSPTVPASGPTAENCALMPSNLKKRKS